jgi:hypothetical protein
VHPDKEVHIGNQYGKRIQLAKLDMGLPKQVIELFVVNFPDVVDVLGQETSVMELLFPGARFKVIYVHGSAILKSGLFYLGTILSANIIIYICT